jgi:beta-lactamase regulating signal transducer with metallopeptidase domain
MIPYILHVTVIITACFLFYKALLQKGTFFRLNRYTLLACVGVSFLLPLVPIPQQWSWRSPSFLASATQQPSSVAPSTAAAPSPGTTAIPPSNSSTSSSTNTSANPSLHSSAEPSTGTRTSPSTNTTPNSSARLSSEVSQRSGLSASPTSGVTRLLPQLFKGLYWLYLFGVIIFGANLLLQIIVLLYQSYTRPIVQDGPFRIVETAGDRAPCSFGHNIFINPSKYDWDTYSQILLHEKIHASDRHTIDILLAEILIVLQWFNPFAWLYRKEVENNLEFLTDQALLRTHEVERSAYQLSLLKVAAPNQPFGITTNYNQSLLKRRIIMMNSKNSSLHTIWRYFFLLPLLTCLVCALNKPAAFGQSTNPSQSGTGEIAATGSPSSSGLSGALSSDRKEGSWFATTKDDKLCFEFKSDKDDHAWSNNTCILKSELANLPGIGKTEFKLVREAGTLYFTGQFDGTQGYGHYSFKQDDNYVQTLRQKGIDMLNDDDLLAFFLLNIKNEYVDMLQHNGYPHVSKNNIIAMSAMGIDHAYIQSWREMGYPNISENDLIAAKAMNIDKAYIEDLHSAGYTSLGVNQLIAFKAQGIDGRYIKQLSHAQGSPPGTSTSSVQASISSIQAYPSGQVSVSTPVNVSTPVRVPPAPVPGAPTKASTPNAATPAVPADQATLPSADDLIAFKSLNIDSPYIASLKTAGYDNIAMNDLITMRSLNIDAPYIKSFQAIGFKDVPVQALVAIKAQEITPEFINGFRSIGFRDISAEQLPALKSLGITPAFVKGFRDIGYTDISLEQLPALKALGITPEFVKQFRSIGFDNIPLDQLPALKSMGVTPSYVTKMKGQGFVSHDLNKYIQLKSAFQ